MSEQQEKAAAELPPACQVLKRDTFGCIELHRDGNVAWIRRELGAVRWPLRSFARRVAGNEARVMQRLAGLQGVPALLRWDGRQLDRSYIAGAPMQEAQPRDPQWYRKARRLIQAMHRRGVVHNDLAKEPNWLVTDQGEPAVIDFQMSRCGQPRGRFQRMLAYEDLRHLLKHKRTYCRQALTPVEWRVLKRKSWLGRLWMATGKRVYRFITRRIMGWEDNEGQGPR